MDSAEDDAKADEDALVDQAAEDETVESLHDSEVFVFANIVLPVYPYDVASQVENENDPVVATVNVVVVDSAEDDAEADEDALIDH